MFDENLSSSDYVAADPSAAQNSYYAYLEEISQYKLLSLKEEISLFQKIQDGDPVAKDLFIKSNLRLVVKQAKKYYRPGYNQLLDLIQDGNIGLLKAVEMYDPHRGCKFSTYATYHINKAIQRSFSLTGLPLDLPAQKISLINKIRAEIGRLEAETGSKPSIKELAENLNVSAGQIRDMLPFISPIISLDAKLNDGENERDLADVFSEHYNVETDDIENQHIIKEMRGEFRKIIYETLGERDAYILLSRWGFFNAPAKDTLTLARELGMSHQGVRQSELRSIAKLKKHLLSLNKTIYDFV